MITDPDTLSNGLLKPGDNLATELNLGPLPEKDERLKSHVQNNKPKKEKLPLDPNEIERKARSDTRII